MMLLRLHNRVPSCETPDGCGTGKLGDLTWPIIRDLVDGIITVSEEEILAATRACYETLKVM